MKVTLDKTYTLPATREAAWALLQNIEAVAGCMPGAKITEKLDATHYKGTVAVKFGPANMSFRGEIEVLALDAANMTLRMVGKGTDTTGGSGAAMDLTARVLPRDAETSELSGVAEVSMSGKAAAFGNRLMGSVAEQVLKQFSTRFIDEVRLVQGRMPKPVAAPVPETAAAGVEATPAAAAAAVEAVPAAQAAAAEAPPPAVAASAPEPKPLSAFGLLWGMLSDWLSKLFGRKS